MHGAVVALTGAAAARCTAEHGFGALRTELLHQLVEIGRQLFLQHAVIGFVQPPAEPAVEPGIGCVPYGPS